MRSCLGARLRILEVRVARAERFFHPDVLALFTHIVCAGYRLTFDEGSMKSFVCRAFFACTATYGCRIYVMFVGVMTWAYAQPCREAFIA